MFTIRQNAREVLAGISLFGQIVQKRSREYGAKTFLEAETCGFVQDACNIPLEIVKNEQHETHPEKEKFLASILTFCEKHGTILQCHNSRLPFIS
jgi:hypothetical protein